MSVTPNIAGFLDAAKRHRSNMGSPVTFHVPVTPSWPAGTKINPDTGRPYSATVVRENAEFTDVVKTAHIVLKEASPMRPQADAHFEEGGLFSGMDIILDIDDADYPDVQNAVEFTVNTLNYRVEEFKPFEVAGTRYRWLIYGMEK